MRLVIVLALLRRKKNLSCRTICGFVCGRGLKTDMFNNAV